MHISKSGLEKLLATLLCFVLVSAVLTGCGGDEDDAGDSDANATQQQPQPQGDEAVPPPDFGTGAAGGGASVGDGTGVDFGLQSPGDPNFSSVPTGDPNAGLYTVEGDYAYALDPATLEKTGPALDPMTHEPVNVEEPTEPEPVQEPVQEPVPEPEPEPAQEPTEETKLPNTGMFLEDD